jgi:hypothetical protein
MILVLLAVFLAIALVGAKRRREYRPLVAITVVGLLVGASVGGRTFASFEPSLWAGLLVVAIVAGLVDVVGRPGWARWRTRPKQEAWRFDKALDAETRPLTDQFLRMPRGADPDEWEAWRRATIDLGRPTIQRIRKLQPPTRDWSMLSGKYADAYERLLEALEANRGLPIVEFNELRDEADAQLITLRRAYGEQRS